MSGAVIVVGVDGSDASARAVQWCAKYAVSLDATVVAVHAVDLPVYAPPTFASFQGLSLTEQQRDNLRDIATRDWCKPLADAGVPHHVVLMDGGAAHAIIEVANTENAELVVTGRRGRGGFAELVLGSTSHHLSHHLNRPFVIVP
jgi:nucleotide-binding universal stress UspA family protein